MTKDEFEKQYADRSGVTVEFLHEHGRFGKPCDCDEEICQGWQMTHADSEWEPPADATMPEWVG